MRIILSKAEKEQRREWGRQGGKKALRKFGRAHFKMLAKKSVKARRRNKALKLAAGEAITQK